MASLTPLADLTTDAIVLVLTPEGGVPAGLSRAFATAKRWDGISIRSMVRSTAAFAQADPDEPPPLLGAIVSAPPDADVAARARGWNTPCLPVAERPPDEVFWMAREWLVACAPEIVAGPRRRAEQKTLSAPFRTYSLQAWEMLADVEQHDVARRVGLNRSFVGRTLMSAHRFDQLRAGDRLALAAALGVWNAQHLRLERPQPPTSLLTSRELAALDEAAMNEGWDDATRALALGLGLRAKRALRDRGHRELVAAFRATREEFTMPGRWVQLVDEWGLEEAS